MKAGDGVFMLTLTLTGSPYMPVSTFGYFKVTLKVMDPGN